MKFIFTADLHIKLNAKNIPKEWQKDRFRLFFRKLKKIAILEKVDFIVIGGDIFDKMPTLAELSFYFELIGYLPVRTFIYDGNHEATRKGKTFLSYLKDATSTINKMVVIVDECTTIGGFDGASAGIIPYCKLKEFAKKGDPQGAAGTEILFTHVRGNIPPYVKEEIPLKLFGPWKTVFAGDLHNHEDSQKNIVYPGAPMSVSFHRNKVKGGVILATDHDWKWLDLDLPQLLRKTVTETDELVEGDYDHIIYELVGNSADLANVDVDTNLLDKKIVTRETDATLELKNKSIKGELIEYLIEIVSLDEDQLNNVLRTFDDYIPNTEIS